MKSRFVPGHAASWQMRESEKREHVRRTAWRVIDEHSRGEPVDQITLQWARDFVRLNPPMEAA